MIVLSISTCENALTLCMKIHGTIYPCFLDVLNQVNVNSSDGYENTLLHMAVKLLHVDLCQTLIKAGANIEAMNNKECTSLLELFMSAENQDINDNFQKTLTISSVLIEHGANVNLKSDPETTVFQVASQWNSERLMLSLLSKPVNITSLTEKDFKLAFTKSWFVYAETLMGLMSDDFLKTFITKELIDLAILYAGSKLLMTLFEKATCDVQKLVIEDLLYHFAKNDENESFNNLLDAKDREPQLFDIGEALLSRLLEDKIWQYCWLFISRTTNKNCFNFLNKKKQTPLQIAIEMDYYDLIDSLIYKCDNLNNEDSNGSTSLMQLFEKLSAHTDFIEKQKILTPINAIICRGGNIYMITSRGVKVIDSCTDSTSKNDIEALQIKINNNYSQSTNETSFKKTCTICLDRDVNCVMQCGHTFCMSCAENLFQCAICKSEATNPKQIYFN